jgi:hypothetical protein
VVKSVLNRYLDNDIGFLTSSGQRYKVPRFLLNDIVRYWRTVCVDYATKHRERKGEKWALRNAKLRLSRKLIFASGLLTCINCSLKSPPDFHINLFNQPEPLQPLLLQLLSYVRLTPLEILAEAMNSYAKPETAILAFDAYDRFLSLINDPGVRKHLSELKAQDTDKDQTFNEIRNISHQFQKGLNQLFFDDNDQVAELTRKYGIF